MSEQISIRVQLGLALLFLAAGSAVPVGAAGAPEHYVPFCTAGSAKNHAANCVHVLEIGPKDAHRVLVLIPGHSEGAELFDYVGSYISGALPDTQVWAFDRREQDLEDLSHFGSNDEIDYYLRGHYRHLSEQRANATRGWGLAMEISELRCVALAAGKGGREVFLGGHSSGRAPRSRTPSGISTATPATVVSLG